jgi:hypothetical protein
MGYFLVWLLLFIAGCNNDKIRLVNRQGKIINSERKMPLYNRQMIEQINKSPNHYKTDDFGEKYYSTGKVETSPVVQNIVSDAVDNAKHMPTHFVPISDINLNESHHAVKTKEILLDKQNLMTKNEYKPKKIIIPKPIKKIDKPKITVSPVFKEKIKKIDKPKIKNNPSFKEAAKIIVQPIPVNKIENSHNLFFIKITEPESILSISDKIKDIKPISNYIIAIEKNKNNDNYQLVIGPIPTHTEAINFQKDLVNKGYDKSVILEK